MGAIESPTQITALGSQMLRYPLDPPHARILIASFDLGCPSEIIDILSLINSGGNVFIDRASDRDAAIISRTKFIHRDGDHLTSMNVLRAYLAIKEHPKIAKDPKIMNTTRWCRENHVNAKTLNNALKIRDQLHDLARREGRDPLQGCGTETAVVGRCLLQGLFMNTALIQSDGTYKQTSGSLVSGLGSGIADAV